MDTEHLEKLRASILIDMKIERKVDINKIEVFLKYDKDEYNIITKDRWDIIEDKPIENPSRFIQLERYVVNKDISRIEKTKDLIKQYGKVIIFYNFNYERDLLLKMIDELDIPFGEWNGHVHSEIPETNKWANLVQYNAGSEGWNCVKTNVIVFYSLNYSYRMMHQAAGRINRRNTLFKNLFYFYFYSDSSIDKAILKSLKEKKDFNERKYYENMNLVNFTIPLMEERGNKT